MSEAFIPAARSLVLRESNSLAVTDTVTNNIFSWLLFKVVDIIIYRAVQNPAVIVMGVVTNVFIIISVLSAFPWVRK